MSAGLIACICTPASGPARNPDGAQWCADNGCFGKGYPGDDAWWSWLTKHPGRELCDFAVAPDVVGDADATLTRSLPWLPRIRSLGIPAAYVGQNGATIENTPWDEFDVLFLGGDTEWKLGADARALTSHAVSLGKPVHMGRVNSERRLRYAHHIGCTSADGTYLVFGPDVNLPHVLAWLRGVNNQPPLDMEVSA